MSRDFLYITPEHYSCETFIDRLQSNVKVYLLEDGRYNIQFSNELYGWLYPWDYSEDGGYSQLEELFSEEEMKLITTINNFKFFLITSSKLAFLHQLSEMIADDPNILIQSETGDNVKWGNEFADLVREGKQP